MLSEWFDRKQAEDTEKTPRESRQRGARKHEESELREEGENKYGVGNQSSF